MYQLDSEWTRTQAVLRQTTKDLVAMRARAVKAEAERDDALLILAHEADRARSNIMLNELVIRHTSTP